MGQCTRRDFLLCATNYHKRIRIKLSLITTYHVFENPHYNRELSYKTGHFLDSYTITIFNLKITNKLSSLGHMSGKEVTFDLCRNWRNVYAGGIRPMLRWTRSRRRWRRTDHRAARPTIADLHPVAAAAPAPVNKRFTDRLDDEDFKKWTRHSPERYCPCRTYIFVIQYGNGFLERWHA